MAICVCQLFDEGIGNDMPGCVHLDGYGVPSPPSLYDDDRPTSNCRHKYRPLREVR